MNFFLSLLLLMVIMISSMQMERNHNYRPHAVEDCDDNDVMQFCKQNCEADGKKFCNFKGRVGYINYTGCLLFIVIKLNNS